MTSPVVSGSTQLPRKIRTVAQFVATSAVFALLTYFGIVLQVNLLTIGLLYLLIVVAEALLFGFWQASLISLVAVVCLDYFFTLPLLPLVFLAREIC